MKNLESKLKKLPLVAPARNLDDRVLAQKPERPVHPLRAPRRVPVWVTVAIALIMAVAGFAGGLAWRSGRTVASHPCRPQVVIQVIYDSPASRNPFDFTIASHFFPAREVETTIRKLEPTI